eukprot:TRINITY_DN4129_c0_g3_i2.p1 TRINITY_DN4129_c0_g3~~TRINITY_DN4129_c0_g3_i2.p1  ORF type:complete len:200 (-),score=19.94 TRINITY_DN4129_c0_g3_i2:22-621(-)
MEVTSGKLFLLMNEFFSEVNRKNCWNNNTVEYWKAYVRKWFSPSATMKLDYLNESMNKKSYTFRFEVLPMIYKSRIDNGISAEGVIFRNPKEFKVTGENYYYFECVDTTIVSSYNLYHVMHHGALMVVFDENLKIYMFEFEAKRFELTINKTCLADADTFNKICSTINDIGLPLELARTYLINEIVSEDRIFRGSEGQG